MTAPRDVAFQDQLVAVSRDLGALLPDTAVITVTVGGEGLDCSWCDCPLEAHQMSGYTCAGCPSKATHIIYLFVAPKSLRLPMCRHHMDIGDFPKTVAELLGSTKDGE